MKIYHSQIYKQLMLMLIQNQKMLKDFKIKKIFKVQIKFIIPLILIKKILMEQQLIINHIKDQFQVIINLN
jgi:hypothetical protein